MSELTDKQIIDSMLESTTVKEWNDKRAEVKEIRSAEWIATYLDASGIINKSNINKKKEQNENQNYLNN